MLFSYMGPTLGNVLGRCGVPKMLLGNYVPILVLLGLVEISCFNQSGSLGNAYHLFICSMVIMSDRKLISVLMIICFILLRIELDLIVDDL